MDDDTIEKELTQLREDIRGYYESSQQQKLDRHIENVQVLIALAVVGATVSIYSSGIINTPFWQDILDSSYWPIVIFVFVATNTLFLILKLLTIPLQKVSNSQTFSYIHDAVEPFLYFFAVAGALTAVVIGGVLTVAETDLKSNAQIFFALVSLALPFICALVYVWAYRLNMTLERHQKALIEINQTLRLFVAAGAMTVEEQSKLMRQLGFLLLPAPNPLSSNFITLFEKISQRLGLVTADVADQFRDSNELFVDYLDGILIQESYPRGVTSWLEIWSELLPAQQQNEQMSKEEREELQKQLAELRNKAVHGQLSDEDVDEIKAILEKYGTESKEEANEDDE